MMESAVTREGAHEIFKGARDYLVRYGWRRRSLGSMGTPACLVGSWVLGDKSTGRWLPQGSLGTLARYLGFEDADAAVRWNDHQADNGKVVLERLERGIEATAPIETTVPEEPEVSAPVERELVAC